MRMLIPETRLYSVDNYCYTSHMSSFFTGIRLDHITMTANWTWLDFVSIDQNSAHVFLPILFLGILYDAYFQNSFTHHDILFF